MVSASLFATFIDNMANFGDFEPVLENEWATDGCVVITEVLLDTSDDTTAAPRSVAKHHPTEASLPRRTTEKIHGSTSESRTSLYLLYIC